MQPSSKTFVTGRQPSHSYHTSYSGTKDQPVERWGAKGRSVVGKYQIFFGVAEIILGLALIILPLSDVDAVYDVYDRLGWGIWNGGFSILTGIIGVASRRYLVVIIFYFVTSIFAALSSLVCAVFGLLWILALIGLRLEVVNDIPFTPFDSPRTESMTHIILWGMLAFLFVLQILVSIVGARFAGGAFCFSANSQAVNATHIEIEASAEVRTSQNVLMYSNPTNEIYSHRIDSSVPQEVVTTTNEVEVDTHCADHLESYECITPTSLDNMVDSQHIDPSISQECGVPVTTDDE